MIQQTSIDAWFALCSKLGKRQERVYEAIQELEVCNNRQISDYLGWPINCVTPRVLELRKKMLVKECGMGIENGRKHMLWTAQ